MLLRPLLIVASFAVLTYADEIDCTNKINKCPEDQGCAVMFPPKGDGSPNAFCTDPTTQTFALLCRKSCNTCCNLPCADHNNNCKSWKTDRDFCTPTPDIPQDRIYDTCAKTCELCE